MQDPVLMAEYIIGFTHTDPLEGTETDGKPRRG